VTNVAALIGPVATILLGEPNRRLSSKGELRYGTNGSLAVDLVAGRWFDHENRKGGGVLDLIERETGRKGRERVAWLAERGLASGPNGSGTIVPQPKPRLGKPTATYDYSDEAGNLLFQVCRYDNPKTFRQRRPDPSKREAWTWSVKGVRQVPYRLAEVLEAIALEKMICVVEGEKDCDRLWRIGVPATTNAMGAGKWSSDLNGHFAGGDVVIIPDNDEAGHNQAADVARNLAGIAGRVRVLDLGKAWPQCPPKGGDVSDYLAGHSREQLDALIEQAPDYQPVEPRRLILSSGEFVAGFVPPDYVLEGVLQRRFIYSLTGKTGAGKTAILLLMAAHVDAAKPLGERAVEKGRVLYLAGENADDVRMRWIAMAQQIGFEVDQVDVFFIAGAFKISAMLLRIRSEIARIGEVSLIVVDTSAAFFEGDAENDNVQLGNHARLLRKLIDMPGSPCVIVACHPVKNATDDNLLPRGGGAFLAEVDGNLTARADEGSVELSTQGKFRGPDFAPLSFLLRTVTHERLKDSKDRLIPTVVASPLSEQGREEVAKVVRNREDELLAALTNPTNQTVSKTELARQLGWLMNDGKPYRVQVTRTLAALKADKLITFRRGRITLTKEGKKAAEEAVRAQVQKNGANRRREQN
jgi:hypothetical protein